MTKEKMRIYTLVWVVLALIFIVMTVYSLWFGAKNNMDIITITDTFTVSAEKSGTSVYLSDALKEKGDIHKYHWLTDDSMVVRLAGQLSKFINPLYIWMIINLLSVAFALYMLYSLIARWEEGVLRAVLLAVFPFMPAFFRGSVQLGAYVLSGVLILCVIYIGTIKGASVVKWYLAMTICALVVSALPEFWIIVYIIPFVAYRDIKISYDGGKAASHILLLLLSALIIHFAYLRAFVDYRELYSCLTGINASDLSFGIKRFFHLDSIQKIGIYLPLNVMALVSVVGLIFAEKYVRKYIYPGVFLYLWTIIFAGNDSYMLAVIYPSLFLAFSQTIIHLEFMRNIRTYIVVGMSILLAVCILCCVNISYNNYTKGLKVSCYVEEYATLYEEYVDDESSVLAVCDKSSFGCQMYAAYPKKTILADKDEAVLNHIISTYHPEYIVSEKELLYSEYENVFSEDDKYVYKLLR